MSINRSFGEKKKKAKKKKKEYNINVLAQIKDKELAIVDLNNDIENL